MKMELMFVLFLLDLLSFLLALGPQELVLVRDLNSDHDRRNIDGGLPSFLEFDLRRESAGVKLTLEENRRLNANAPVYEIQEDERGKRILIEKDVPPIADVRFYQDKKAGGTFSVRCQLTVDGPCRRMMTGNLYIDGRNYDLEPAPEMKFKRGFKFDEFGTPHFLVENEVAAMNYSANSTKSLEIKDTKDIDEDDNLIDKELLLMELKELWERKRANGTDRTQQNQGYNQREKRATSVYAVEIYVTLDPSVWKKYYDLTEGTNILTKAEATELRLRQHFSHIINGVSLRYESIEDLEMEIYCTISGFLIYKTRNSLNPLPLGEEITISGREYADSDVYLESLIEWSQGLTGLPANDHIMVFTAYELFNETPDQDAVQGIAYMKGVCRKYRLSLNQIEGFFATTSVATHELGHSLGAPHDGSGISALCDPLDWHIMAPYTATFREEDEYSINPWTFSQCSVNAFKTTFEWLTTKRRFCLGDTGDYYNYLEYQEHTSKLPGQLHSIDAQCKLLEGENSRVCTSTDPNSICLVLKCLSAKHTCKYYTPARGTECGGTNSNMWCIDGACVPKRPAEPVMPTYGTTSCIDVGFEDIASCDELRTWYNDFEEFCEQLYAYCCATCKDLWTPKTRESTSTASTTVLSTTSSGGHIRSFPCIGDVGHGGLSCVELKMMLGSIETLCSFHSHECCMTCEN